MCLKHFSSDSVKDSVFFPLRFSMKFNMTNPSMTLSQFFNVAKIPFLSTKKESCARSFLPHMELCPTSIACFQDQVLFTI